MEKIEELLMKYCTARIDIKNSGDFDNNINILDKSDSNALTFQPFWFNNHDGIGTQVESNKGKLDLKIKCINDGTLKIWLKGIEYLDINNQIFPIFIDFTNVQINNQKMLNENRVVSCETPHYLSKQVNDGEILKLHFEWLPFNENSKYINQTSILEQKVRSIPQLSCTSFGYPVLNGKMIYRNYRSYGPDFTLLNDFNGFCENQWFTVFLRDKFPDVDFKINFFSVSNAHDNLAYPMRGKKVLYSLEDLKYRYLEMKVHYNKYALDYVDLAIGYDHIDNPKYMRLPFWIVKHFSPNITEEEIENKVNLWNSINYKKTRDVVAIASHDNWGVRTLIADDINNISEVTYAGKWKNNTSDLWNKFNNNKYEFLKQFKFNLCAENLINDAYVTEKIFDAFNSACIPLYAGGGDYFEPRVINPNAVIRWDGQFEMIPDQEIYERAYYGEHSWLKGNWIANDGQNSDALELFNNIRCDEKTYKEFIDQNKLVKTASKFIIKKFQELEKQFERVIYS